MNTVEAAKAIRAIIDDGFSDQNFIPPPPPRKTPRVRKTNSDPLVENIATRDDTSSWSIFIEYQDSGGFITERRITILRFEHRVGGWPALAALCHECGEHRLFRVDRIRQIMDISTGELLEIDAHIALLRAQGLPVINRGMASFCRILAFIARCDGEFHQTEHFAIEDALTSYALRFDGSGEDIEKTLAAIKNMTPDTVDLNNSLVAILRSPAQVRNSVANLLLRCIGQIIDADGLHTVEEIAWAVCLRDCIMIIRD